MFSVEKISVAYATPTPPVSWHSCAPLSSLWCAAPATIHSKSPKRSSLMIPTKLFGYSVPDRLPEWSVKFWSHRLFKCSRLDRILGSIRLARFNPLDKNLAKHADRTEFHCSRILVTATRADALGLRAHRPNRPSAIT